VVQPFETSYDFAVESQNPRIQRPHPLCLYPIFARPVTSFWQVADCPLCNRPPGLSITHISDGAFALIESFVILFVTPIRGGVTDERGEGSQYIRLA